MTGQQVPAGLKNRFIVDLLLAVPLFFMPVAFLSLLGWQHIDPYAAQIAAAALFGVGIASLFGRNASVQTIKNMLNLKSHLVRHDHSWHPAFYLSGIRYGFGRSMALAGSIYRIPRALGFLKN
jgi:hypothetical protein